MVVKIRPIGWHGKPESRWSWAASGLVTDAQRSVFNSVSRTLLREQGAEAIMLAGTDLALVFHEQTAEFPLVDCAAIHVDAIAKLALS